jgi:hypothetical protein
MSEDSRIQKDAHKQQCGDGVVDCRDVFLQGDCDDGVRRICHLAGWEDMLGQGFEECQ